ncbi:hypothetical protein ACRALDRAFT_1053633 [Sodiomyces alcalophilus JCM 7366]|uniref:uncharacterized protein n=1 Tax=Sodiomyces alcalophilus JCM 7366 TaxID=591952 RepID=UPI0039B3B3E7
MGAGLIDDPDKPKRLEDAIDFKGICEDMCPEFEKLTRIFEYDVPLAEKDPNTNFPDTSKMVKKLARSAAGQEAPLPMDVRTTAALRRTLEYLVNDLLKKEEDLLSLHGYLWDRTRAIRRDFVFHSTMTLDEMRDQVYCLETIARFHVTALHTLSKPGIAPEDFSQQQEMEQLGKTLLSLLFAYDDGSPQGLVSPNEFEFRAYHLLFFCANQPNVLDTVQKDPANARAWKESDLFRTAVSLAEALHRTVDLQTPLRDGPSVAVSGDANTYFKLVEDGSVSYTMACFAEIHFGQLRRSILRALRKAYRKSNLPAKDITPAVLNSYLKFDTDQEAVDFAQLHDLSFVPNEDAPLDKSREYLKVTGPLSLPRLRHAFSRNIVEKKRGSYTLPDVICNRIHQTDASGKGPSSHTVDAAKVGDGSGSLFGPPSQTQPPAFGKPSEPKAVSASSATGTTKSTFGQSPFASLPQTASAASANTTTPFAASPSPATTFKSPFSSGPATSTDQKNPFSSAPAVASESTKPPPSTFSNPFSSTPSAPTPPPSSSPFTNPFSQPAATSAAPEQANEPRPGTSPFAIASGLGQTGGTSAFSSTPFAQTSTASTGTTQAPSGISAAKPPTGFGKPSDATPSSAGPFASLPAAPAPSTGPSGQQPLPNLLSSSKQPQAQGSPFEAPRESKAPPAPAAFTFASGTSQASSSPLINQPTATPASPRAAPSTFAFGQTPAITVTPASPAPVPPAGIPQDASKIPSGLGSAVQPLPSPESQSQPQPRPDQTVAPPKPAPPPAPQPPPPKRDLLGDFTKWFVHGDQGLLQEFEIFVVEHIVRQTFDQFVEDEAEKKHKEEEERDLAEARQFQVYNLRVKYFYRWREIARRLRVKRLRQRDREQYRAALAAMRAKEAAKKKKAKEVEAAKKAALERNQGIDPVEEFRELLCMKRDDSSHDHEEALLASGILSGVENEREAVARIIRDQPVSAGRANSTPKKNTPNDNGTGSSRLSQSVQGSKAGGAKIQALRAQFSGSGSGSDNPNSHFRRSLPSMSGISSASSRPLSPGEAPPKRISRVSDRWRLKAMGLVTMPDGTALPETLANSMRYEGKRYDGWGSFGLDDPATRRHRSRSTSADLGQAAAARARFSQSLNSSGSGAGIGSTLGRQQVNGMSPPTSKRKRTAEEEGGEKAALVNGPTTAKRRAASNDKVERILQEARETLGSLKSSRAELDETAGWFREQSEMMQEQMSCGGSSWGGHG